MPKGKRDQAKRCMEWDGGRRCYRLGIKHYKDSKRWMCKKHYDRAWRKDGDTRHPFEIRRVEFMKKRDQEREQRESRYNTIGPDTDTKLP